MLEDRERASILHHAIRKLPKPQATAVTLHYFQGHPTQKVARIMGTTEKTACKRLRSSREKLYYWLTSHPDYKGLFVQ